MLAALLLSVIGSALAPAASTQRPYAQLGLQGRFLILEPGVPGRVYTTLPVDLELLNPGGAAGLQRLRVELFDPVVEGVEQPFARLESLAPAVTAHWRGELLVNASAAQRLLRRAFPWPMLAVRGWRDDGTAFEQHVVLAPVASTSAWQLRTNTAVRTAQDSVTTSVQREGSH